MRRSICQASFSQLCLIGALGLMMALSTRAVAETSASHTAVTGTADTLFSEGVKQFKQKNFAKALAHFTRVSELKDSPNVRLYIGYCHMELGNELDAHRAFTHTIKLAFESADAKYVAAREAAQEQLNGLNHRLAKLTISLVEGQNSSMVSLDNQQLEPSQLGSPIIVSPGLHRIVAESKGAKSITRNVELERGGSKTVTLMFEQPTGAVAQPMRTEGMDAHGQPWTTYGIVAGSLGLIGFGVFAVAGYQTRNTYQQLRTECSAGCSDDAHRDMISSGKTYQTTANVGLAVGALGTLAGTALLYLGYSRESRVKPSVELNAGNASVSVQGSF